MSTEVLERPASPLAWDQYDFIERERSDWRRRPARQQPAWPDVAAVRDAIAYLVTAAPLVEAAEVRELRRALAAVALGEGFVFQAGDCAESFETPTAQSVGATVGLLRESAQQLRLAIGRPVTPIGRIAGQYGKPRSAPTERIGGLELPAFRGFIVNGPEATTAARTPDAARLLRAYEHSMATTRILRRGSAADRISTSHEALLLDYEDALVRWDAAASEWFLSSTHLPWVGVRTHDPDEAHVRFLAALANPVGCKVGPDTTPEALLRICRRLDPDRDPGRLVLISRMGADHVYGRLPAIVRKVADAGHPVVWLCDPMHGNTVRSGNGFKVRHLERIKAELAAFFQVLPAAGVRPGGVHLEASARPVTECIGGGVTEQDLPLRYESVCDPRLNGEQTAEIVRFTAEQARTE